MAGGERPWKPEQTAVRRRLSIALASLFVAALVAPTAQGATRVYSFQDNPAPWPEHLAIELGVLYKNKQRHGPYTPRNVSYDGWVPISCNPPVGPAAAGFSTGNTSVKLIKGSFTDPVSSDIPSTASPPGHIRASFTGTVIKKKRKGEKLRVNGSVSIFDFSLPALGQYNCTSGGQVPYSATPCRPYGGQRPPYIKPGLPVCFGGP